MLNKSTMSCKAVPFWQTWATAGPSMTFRQSLCVDVTTGNSELFVLSSSASSDDSNLSVPFFQLPGPLTRMSSTFFVIACGLTNVHILRHPLREVDSVFDRGVLNLIKAQQKKRIDAQKKANESYRRRRRDELENGSGLN